MDIPTSEPTKLTIGDYWTWEKTLDDYTPTDYDLSYIFYLEKTPSTKFTINATDDSGSFLVAVTDTNSYTSGDYVWTSFVTDTNNYRTTVENGRTELLPNPASVSADQRSHARICLDAIKLVLEGKASKDILSYTINGRQLQKMTYHDLLEAYSYFSAQVSKEESETESLNGRDSGMLIRCTFEEAS
jgi:hypothetical protein